MLTSQIIQIQQSQLDILLENNTTENISEYFETYLLIGSDRRSENTSLARGFVQGQRADVIILALINNSNSRLSLVSLPRDLLIKNPCTDEIQRINSTFQKNECGNTCVRMKECKNLDNSKKQHERDGYLLVRQLLPRK